MRSKKIGTLIFFLIAFCILFRILYIKNATFYDLRPLFFENRILYESMIEFIEQKEYFNSNELNKPYEQEFHTFERQLSTKAKVSYVNKPYENEENIHFHRGNQTIIYSKQPEEKIRQRFGFYEKLENHWYYFYSSGGESNIGPPPPYKKP